MNPEPENELKNDSPNQGRKRDAESGSKGDGAKGRELLAIPFLCAECGERKLQYPFRHGKIAGEKWNRSAREEKK